MKHELETVLAAINGGGIWVSPDTGRPLSSFGNITTIANRLGVERGTIYNYIKRWATVAQAIEDTREMKKDVVEDKMLKRILEGSDTMIIFFAKTQMRDRGYIERVHQDNFNYDLSKATDEQLRRITNGEHPATVLADTSAS